MLIALALSILFALVVGIAAARNKKAEAVIIPSLDVLQSIPILGFFPIVILAIISVLPSQIGVNIAVIILIFTSMSLNIAFGGDSLVELLSSFAVVQHLRTSLRGRPSSTAHVETERAEWVTTLLLLSLIPVIGLAAVYSFLNGIKPESSLLGIAVAIGAVVIMPVLWFEKKRIGVASNCLPLTIDAVESATCFWISAALLSGLAINYVWKVSWIDYLATLAILGFVAREGLESINEVRES